MFQSILIQDILVQGNTRRVTGMGELPVHIHPESLSRRHLNNLFGPGAAVVLYQGGYYFLSPGSSPISEKINMMLLPELHRARIEEAFHWLKDKHASSPISTIRHEHMTESERAMLLELTNFFHLMHIEKSSTPRDLVTSALDMIQKMADYAYKKHLSTPETQKITRITSDEFTFYAELPFSLEQYKALIHGVHHIAIQLPPDIHMLLGTIPVLWPDLGIHNCALHVQSPLEPGHHPTLHHINKTYSSDSDLTYFDLPIKTDFHAHPDWLPDTVLKDTEVQINDINQYYTAILAFTSYQASLIISIGICLDHKRGIERFSVRNLIRQLHNHHREVPWYCSQVISSASINLLPQHQVSTLTHADPYLINRDPVQNQLELSFFSSPFSGGFSSECYVLKHIGLLHSDLFDQLASAYSEDKLKAHLNHQDERGDTIMHHLIMSTTIELELLAKRLYSMILHGADPTIPNIRGRKVIDVAQWIDLKAKKNLLVRAINSALTWQASYKKQNEISMRDGRTILTREIKKRALSNSSDVIELGLWLKQRIALGANIFLKDSFGDNAFELMLAYTQFIRSHLERYVLDRLHRNQFGYDQMNSNEPGIENKEDLWFRPFEAFKVTDALKNYESLYKNLIGQLISHHVDLNRINQGAIVSGFIQRELKSSHIPDAHQQYMTHLNQWIRDNHPSSALRFERLETPFLDAFFTHQKILVQKVDDFAITRYISLPKHVHLLHVSRPFILSKVSSAQDILTLARILPEALFERCIIDCVAKGVVLDAEIKDYPPNFLCQVLINLKHFPLNMRYLILSWSQFKTILPEVHHQFQIKHPALLVDSLGYFFEKFFSQSDMAFYVKMMIILGETFYMEHKEAILSKISNQLTRQALELKANLIWAEQKVEAATISLSA